MKTEQRTPTPAERLAGIRLRGGWTVDRLVERPESATGGCFSTSYIVHSNDGHSAFLKAMDYYRALGADDPAHELELITTAYNFERALLEKCTNRNLSRIVRILDSGQFRPLDGAQTDVVEYLIFELAGGDIRSFIANRQSYETAWALRILHQVAAALQQLHSLRIAHQDLKPSNVLLFEGRKPKLADLGRAFDGDGKSPYDDYEIAGDITYAPPELLYGRVSHDWTSRRFGCDMYLFGSLILFFCTNCSMTHLLFSKIPEEFRPKFFRGNYGDVLPYLEHEFASLLRKLRQELHPDYAADIVTMIRQLCNPDPSRRGHPRAIVSSGNQYSLERYISLLGNLASRAEYSLKGSKTIRRMG